MITSNLVLDNRRKTEKGIYQIKIRVTANSIQKYYQTNYFATNTQYADLQKANLSNINKEIRIQLDYLLVKAKTIIGNMNFFTFQEFERQFCQQTYTKTQTLKSLFQSVIDEKFSRGDIATATSYKSCYKKLELFKPNISMYDVTPDFLKRFQQYISKEGRSITTVGIYCRNLKAIMNTAIRQKLIPVELYPFGKGKYIIPKASNPKRALTKEEVGAFFNYQPRIQGSMEDRAKDFWFLSYFCNGMNVKDILLLKKKDVKGEFLYFVREKTQRNDDKSDFVTVPLLHPAKAIIEKWSCSNSDNIFLFPFLNSEMSDMDVYNTVQQFIKMTNKFTKCITKSLEFTGPVTTYWARHSFSKALQDSGQPIMYISKCLNHKKVTTTQSYLNSFSDYDSHGIAEKALMNWY